MKKLLKIYPYYWVLFLFLFSSSCGSEYDSVQEVKNILSKKNSLQPKIQKIEEEEASAMKYLDSLSEIEVENYNKNAVKKVKFNKKPFPIGKVSDLSKYLASIPDKGYLLIEFGIDSSKAKFNDQTLLIAAIDSNKKNPKMLFAQNHHNKMLLKDAYYELYNNGKISFFDSLNFGGIVFNKDSSIDWIKKKPLNDNLFLHPVMDFDSTDRNGYYYTSAIISNAKKISPKKPSIFQRFFSGIYYGNRGSNCCP